MQKPIIPLTLAYTAGLLLGHGFLYFPYSISILAILCVLTSGIFIRLDRLTLRRSLLIVLPGLIGMAAYVYSAAWSPANHYTRHFTPDKAFHEIIGKVASPLDRDPDRTGLVMEINEIDGSAMTGKIRVSVRGEMNSVGYGDIYPRQGKSVRTDRVQQSPGIRLRRISCPKQYLGDIKR